MDKPMRRSDRQLTDEETLQLFRDAPVLIAMATQTARSGYERDGSYTTKKEDRWQYFDAGIACQTFCLAAHEMGLATVIMGIYDEDKLPTFIGLPEDQVLTAMRRKAICCIRI